MVEEAAIKENLNLFLSSYLLQQIPMLIFVIFCFLNYIPLESRDQNISNGDGLSAVIIGGIIGGVIVFIAIIILLFTVVWLRKHSKQEKGT